ncbi:MAG: hypothetical protein ABSF95_02455 [Verrucomicrobiota bacterium]|jgi:hypothetical protein
MSTLPDNEFDLEKLFLPAWAQQPASAKYAHYEGEEEKSERRGERRGPRPPRREGPPAQRQEEFRPRGQPRSGWPRPEGGGGRPAAGGRAPVRRAEPRERREPPPPLVELNVALLPEEKGVDSLARQIKMTGRAYPLFDIAQMILQKPERHAVVFSVKKNAEGQPLQPLFLCALDDTVWLSEDEAVAHVLRKHFATFYEAERTPKEPPKGTYTFVAQCGLSGVILGPPNYHDYQNQLRKLHAERFSRMPFEVFKSRVRIVRDEEVVKKWVEDQSWRTVYNCLNLPEPLRLGSQDEVEKHFRETHKENIIKPVESHTLSGSAARALRSPDLVRLIRSVWEDQRRFPLQLATVLSQQFATRGLQFFKVNKSITHVCVARPHYLDLAAAPVSEGVKRIVEHIDAHPKCTRRDLIETLAPSPAPAPGPAAAAAPGEAPPPAPQPEANQPTPEQTVVIADLHWLIHQGHVIEFANGILETAKKPAPRPPKPEPKPAEPPAPAEPQMAAAPAGEMAAAAVPAAPQSVPSEPPTAYSLQPTACSPAPVPESVPSEPPQAAEASAAEAPPTAGADLPPPENAGPSPAATAPEPEQTPPALAPAEPSPAPTSQTAAQLAPAPVESQP